MAKKRTASGGDRTREKAIADVFQKAKDLRAARQARDEQARAQASKRKSTDPTSAGA